MKMTGEQLDRHTRWIKKKTDKFSKLPPVSREYGDDKPFPMLHLKCTEQQARIIKKLVAKFSYIELMEKGFSYDEAREVFRMHESI